jgi:hypothetical protein
MLQTLLAILIKIVIVKEILSYGKTKLNKKINNDDRTHPVKS